MLNIKQNKYIYHSGIYFQFNKIKIMRGLYKHKPTRYTPECNCKYKNHESTRVFKS